MKIAILGTGTMGTALSKVLLKQGKELIVYNRTADRTVPLVELGATAAASPEDAVREADAVIVVVLDGNAARETLLSESVLRQVQGKKILTVTTMSAEDIAFLNEKIRSAGGNYAEVFIAGDAHDAEEGLLFLLGCDEEVKAFWQQTLGVAGEVIHTGGVGAGANAGTPYGFNTLFMCMQIAYTAAISIKYQIPEEVAVRELSGYVPHAQQILPALLKRDYSSGMATVDGFQFTGQLMLDTAKAMGLDANVLDAIVGLYEKASRMGYGDQAESAIVEALLSE